MCFQCVCLCVCVSACVRACVRACVVVAVVAVDFCLFVCLFLHIIDKSTHNCEKECMNVIVSWSLMLALVFLTTNIFLDRSILYFLGII